MTQPSPLLYSNESETFLNILPVEFFLCACDLYQHTCMYVLTLLVMLSQYLAIVNIILWIINLIEI